MAAVGFVVGYDEVAVPAPLLRDPCRQLEPLVRAKEFILGGRDPDMIDRLVNIRPASGYCFKDPY